MDKVEITMAPDPCLGLNGRVGDAGSRYGFRSVMVRQTRGSCGWKGRETIIPPESPKVCVSCYVLASTDRGFLAANAFCCCCHGTGNSLYAGSSHTPPPPSLNQSRFYKKYVVIGNAMHELQLPHSALAGSHDTFGFVISRSSRSLRPQQELSICGLSTIRPLLFVHHHCCRQVRNRNGRLTFGRV